MDSERTLQKSLTQDSTVRQQVYQGVYEVACKNPKLSHAILELLYTQFVRYYHEKDDHIPPIKLEFCAGNKNHEMKQLEPLDHLICTLQLCTQKSGRRLDRVEEEDEALSHLLDNVEDMLDSLTKRMMKTDLEDFNLDKTAEYQSSTEDGTRNKILASIVLGLYEVLIEYNFMKDNDLKVETCETVHHLFEKYQALIEVLQESGGNNAKKTKTNQTKIQRHSLLSFKCLTTMLEAIICNNDNDVQPKLNLLRKSSSLAKYLATSVVFKLQQLATCRQCDGAGGKNVDHLFRQCLSLSRTFIQHINGDAMIPVDVLDKDKGKKLGNTCLEGLNHIIAFVCSHLPGKVTQMLENLDFHPDVISQNSSQSEGSLVYRIIRRIQRIIIKIVTSPEEDLGLKEAQVLVTMLSYLTPYLRRENEVALVYTWFMRFCVENSLDDIPLLRTIMLKFLSLHHQCKGTLATISKICQDIHSQIGDIDEGIEVENSSNFALINENNAAPTVFVLISQHIERILDEGDLVLCKLKKCNEQDCKAKQTKLCQTLIEIVLSLHELVQSAFNPGTCADIITKVVTKLYTILGGLTKYFLAQYALSKTRMVEKFDKLMKLTGSHLVLQIYSMISYMQSTQAQDQTVNTTSRQKEKKKSNRYGKSRAMKDSKCIPNLIYRIEEFERCLIQLSKKSNIDYSDCIKRSTARDFRISAACLDAALQETQLNESNESNVTDNDATNATKTNSINSTSAQKNSTKNAQGDSAKGAQSNSTKNIQSNSSIKDSYKRNTGRQTNSPAKRHDNNSKNKASSTSNKHIEVLDLTQDDSGESLDEEEVNKEPPPKKRKKLLSLSRNVMQ